MKLLYVHGYNGDPNGESYQNLKAACGDNHEILTIDYNPEFPKQAITDLFEFVKENNVDCVIGASLGGFLAMNLYGISRIVVNPCWDPANELPQLGYTGDTSVYKELLDNITNNTEEGDLCIGVFAVDDEVFGRKYVDEFKKHFKLQYDIDGGHDITETVAKDIIKYIIPKQEESVKDFEKKFKNVEEAAIEEVIIEEVVVEN